jgi:hypothetical protein
VAMIYQLGQVGIYNLTCGIFFFLDILIINVTIEVNKQIISSIVEPSPSKYLLGKPGGIPSPVAKI